MAAKDAAALAIEREQFSAHGCRIVARGQIDLFSAPLFKTELVGAIDDGMTQIVVDLTDVEFIDSTALGVLVGVSKRLRLLGGSMAIISPDATVRRVFEITGLANRFEFVHDPA